MITSPHLEALGLKLFTDWMNLRLTQQLLSGQRLGLEQPEMPLKLIETSERSLQLGHLAPGFVQNWNMCASFSRAVKEP